MTKKEPEEPQTLSSISFALETSTELADRRTSGSASSSENLHYSPLLSPPRTPKACVLFLRDFTTPSTLIEQALKRSGFHVTVARDVEHLKEELTTDIHGLILIDNSLPLTERLLLLAELTSGHRPPPVMMVFEPGAEEGAARAREGGAVDCVVRDGHGEYLLTIPTLVEKYARPNVNSTVVLPRSQQGTWESENTDRVDLEALAEEVRGMTAETPKACLVVLAGPDVGTVVQLDGSVCVVGRDPSCKLRLRDESISRFHSSIKQHKNGAVTIKDLNSTNGTYVGGRQRDIAELKDGDKILLGQDTLIKYQLQDSIDKNYHDELYVYSTRDGLTGLYNRRSSMERIRTNMSYAKRHSFPVSLLMLDIDHFKRVNDTYGHLAGDQVLATVAKIALSTVRTEDILGRYGGEEFILFALHTDLAGSEVLAERIRSKIEQEIIVIEDDPRSIRTTVSIGIASIVSGNDYHLDKLISVADINLYKAKDRGRNCIVASELKTTEG